MNLDPRVRSTEKLTPRHPLPHVSRRALGRVKDWMPPPERCPYCDGRVRLVDNAEIYRGRSYGDWPYAYLCKPCDAFVGLHPDTDLPLGTMANGELRHARKTAKSLWMDVTKAAGLNRTKAYAWLAEQMNIPKAECHFGHFDLKRAKQALSACELASSMSSGRF